MSIFSIQKFRQNIPNFDTLERVWQSLFKVYNQTLRQIGDNDFSVEHTGVRVRQMTGTLERVVKYDAVAFQKAWDFLASSDDEVIVCLFFRRIIFPGKGAKYGLFVGDCFFAAVGPCRVMSLEKKKFQLKKRLRFRKHHRRGHRTRARARISITPQTYGTEKIHTYTFTLITSSCPRSLIVAGFNPALVGKRHDMSAEFWGSSLRN